MTSPVILILGSGPRVGSAISDKFAADGYKVAIVSRKGSNSINEKGYLSLQADLANTDPSVLASVFDKVKSEFKTAPSVVVYNAASLTPPADKDSALSIPAASQHCSITSSILNQNSCRGNANFTIPQARVTNDLNVNVVSPFIAAQEAIKNWETLSAGGKKLFIYTGNIMNVGVIPVPLMLNLGVGKAASAYWVGLADGAYAAKGYR